MTEAQSWQAQLTALSAASTEEEFQRLREEVNACIGCSTTQVERRDGNMLVCSAPMGRGDMRHWFYLARYADGIWRKA